MGLRSPANEVKNNCGRGSGSNQLVSSVKYALREKIATSKEITKSLGSMSEPLEVKAVVKYYVT